MSGKWSASSPSTILFQNATKKRKFLLRATTDRPLSLLSKPVFKI